MTHVTPHRWAEATGAERAAMDRHADGCAKCRGARDRVQRATDSFPALRAQSTPELGWDSIRARVHWAVSTEKHAKLAPPARKWWLGGLAVAACAGGAAGLFLVHSGSHGAGLHDVIAAGARPVAGAPSAEHAEHALISRLAGRVLVDGIAPEFAKPLGQGTVIATGAGRLDAQFGDASAFALEPQSTLELRRFDADAIELAVDGTVDVVVAPLRAHQRFLVDAGDRVVEVRGTRFQVRHDASGTFVACQHGLVAVRDSAATSTGSTELEVGAARKATVPAGQPLAGVRAVPLSADELADLARTTPWAVPGWTPDLGARTAPLDITSTGRAASGTAGRTVRIDGIELGVAPFAVRVAPGRHTVEAADAGGRYRRAGWVDVGAAPAAPVTFDAVPVPVDDEPVATRPAHTAAVAGGLSAIAQRKAQLAGGVDHAALARCTRPVAQQGLTGAYVQIEIAVDATGAVSYLNVTDTDLPQTISDCVHDALAAVHFGAGPPASWREKLAL